jgi:hypothetical protein
MPAHTWSWAVGSGRAEDLFLFAGELKRRLFTAMAILSCLLALAAAISWVRSYSAYDQLSCDSGRDRYRCTWKSYAPSFRFSRWPPGIPEGASGATLICYGKISLAQAVYSEVPVSVTGTRGYGWSSDENVIPSFSYFYAVTGDMTRRGHWTVRQVTVRHWALVLLFALLPAAWLFCVAASVELYKR